MAAILGTYGVTLRDARGQTGKVKGYYVYQNTSAATVGDSANAARAICAAIAAMSNAANIAQSGLASEATFPRQYGANAEFPNAEDKAVLTYLSAAQTLVRFSVPAPLASIFLADGETVDPANGLLATLTGHLTSNDAGGGFATSAGASALTAFVGGARTRRRFQRKTTIWTLDPTETIPEE